MSKGLEAFKYIFDTIPMPDVDKETKQKIYCTMDDIEKELKALEIIKKYSFVFVEKGELKSGRYADIELLLDETDFENQEEYELLKEVLCNE